MIVEPVVCTRHMGRILDHLFYAGRTKPTESFSDARWAAMLAFLDREYFARL